MIGHVLQNQTRVGREVLSLGAGVGTGATHGVSRPERRQGRQRTPRRRAWRTRKRVQMTLPVQARAAVTSRRNGCSVLLPARARAAVTSRRNGCRQPLPVKARAAVTSRRNRCSVLLPARARAAVTSRLAHAETGAASFCQRTRKPVQRPFASAGEGGGDVAPGVRGNGCRQHFTRAQSTSEREKYEDRP
jgi:hypothetical protein